MTIVDTRSNLGKKARDKITGFEGTITACASYLTGCDQYGLTPPVDANGKTQSNEWFDSGRVEILGDGLGAADVAGAKNGGPNRDAPNR